MKLIQLLSIFISVASCGNLQKESQSLSEHKVSMKAWAIAELQTPIKSAFDLKWDYSA